MMMNPTISFLARAEPSIVHNLKLYKKKPGIASGFFNKINKNSDFDYFEVKIFLAHAAALSNSPSFKGPSEALTKNPSAAES
jgi:hypothetical protein